ncbi:MAG TPA: hypothetical protein VMN77_09295 [Nitrospiria bacterium]|jgi:hypothetical protein|nr:hypothetical protein [Nitrospiria bacterium]
MRRIFSLVSIGVYTAAVFMAGMLVGQLYALYVLVYTGAVFMIGVYIGEKLEERFSAKAAPSVDGSESELTEVRESDELTLKR